MINNQLLTQLPVATVSRQIDSTMQFDPSDLVHSTQANNNNNSSADMFSSLDKSSTKTREHNANIDDDQIITVSSPSINPSESSDSSQAHNNDDCNVNCAHNSSPSSPQSSYNSSFGSNSGRKLINSSNSSITALVPGGVVTTQNISTVIKPKSNSNSLQFVKIQTPELSKKAVEQIRIAEERNISKEKIKEVEEEWQNNLLNWKSKRRQQFPNLAEHESTDHIENGDTGSGRKIKTFAEMLEQRAKSGNRLGFNLQRYISTDDGDDELEAPQIRRGPESPRERVDSDCEIQSSTSSGFNHTDSRSPSSLEVSHPNKKVTVEIPTCDSNTTLRQEPKDVHSISLVQRPENDQQLNSTLKQGIKSPCMEVTSGGLSRPAYDCGNKLNDIMSRSDDDSDNSGLGGDEEEEQKQLQRIAFEAKLKAFEKLTKPEPAPKRNAILSKQTNLRKQTAVNETHSNPIGGTSQKFVNPAPREVSSPQVRLAALSKPIKKNTVQPISHARQPQDLGSSIENEARKPESFSQEVLPPATSTTKIRKPPSPPVQLAERRSRDKPVASMVDDSSFRTEISNLTLEDKPYLSFDNIAQQSKHELDQLAFNNGAHLKREQFTQPQSEPIQIYPDKTPPQTQLANTRQLGSSVYKEMDFPPSLNYQETLNLVQPRANVSADQQVTSEKKNQPTLNRVTSQINNSSQDNLLPMRSKIPSPQESPRREITPSHKRAPREDKDKTVLSVSGKKRCSSCREELGRGAAAFVVESLSLVYHTNCFRCSVCHVNLSNGFRGVDVRVHAGALHCQNCYSKDGLNYSRV